MAYLEVEIDVDDIDWEYESVGSCLRAVNSILDEHKEIEKELRQKLRIPQVDPAYATRKAIEKLSLEAKIRLFDELFSDLLPNELAAVRGLLLGKYDI